MERNYMNPEIPADFRFVEDLSLPSHYHENIELLFILDGEMDVRVEDASFHLGNDDLILINASRSHSYEAGEGILAVRFQLSSARIQKLLKQNHVMFWCNSAADENEAYSRVRELLMKILSAGLDAENTDEIYMQSLYYQLLSVLCANFLINEKKAAVSGERNSGRIDEIFAYIRANYRDPISLQDVADELYLSPTYLSKFIRRNTGLGFLELISSVRLGHAMEDLMYTDASIMKIAMDNGFASVAAFNKSFREAYEMTPSEFRRKNKGGETGENRQNEELVRKTVQYLSGSLSQDTGADKEESGVVIDLNKEAEETFANLFNPMVNAGTAADLCEFSCQEEILLCRKKLGTEYVRFWNPFGTNMLINIHAPDGRYNFAKLDRVLDFLVNNQLKPYIELRQKRQRLISSMENMLYENEAEDDFISSEERTAFYTAFMKHLLKRYGILEVKEWCFDYCARQDTVYNGERFELKPLSDEELVSYLKEFSETSRLIRSFVPGIRIGGAGFPVQHYGRDGLKKVFSLWKEYETPSFVSVTSFPYQIVRTGGVTYEKRRTDMSFLAYDLAQVRSAMEEAEFTGPAVHVTEFNLTLSARNPVNDSTVRAAFLVSSALSAGHMADLAGVWNLRDSYTELANSPEYLFGGTGLLTRNGVLKPAMRAMEFMNRMYEKCVFVNRDLAVSVNSASHLKIIAHNLRRMNVSYFMTDEDRIKPENLSLMREDNRKKHIRIRIENCAGHLWQIRRYRLNRDHGSIQDEWIRLGMDPDMNYDDAVYLEQICVPALYVEKTRPAGGVLEFDLLLEPDEVQYIHVTRAGD